MGSGGSEWGGGLRSKTPGFQLAVGGESDLWARAGGPDTQMPRFFPSSGRAEGSGS